MTAGDVVLPSGRQFEIAHGDQRVVVVEVGGGLRSYTVGDVDVLDGYPVDGTCTSGRGQVLIPWPNRIEDGRYDFDGENYQLALDEPDQRNAIHGLVRWGAWSAAERAPGRVVMSHTLHPQPGYPFSLALSIEYTLSEEGLGVQTTATNVSADACPYGAGAHPYLTLGTPTVDSLLLRAPGRTVIRSDSRGLPLGEEPVEGTECDFRQPRALGGTQLDHAFMDLDRDDGGLARVELTNLSGGDSLVLWLDEAYPYLQLFTGDPLPDVARRSIAVEPMTCPPNAFRTGESVIRLEPGQSFTSRWGLALTSSDSGDAASAAAL
jgi:aldose 1-epimerase